MHQFFVGQKILHQKFCWTQRRTVNILRHGTSMGNWVKVAMWPCGLLREADKLPNGYRGDTAEGLMDPLAKATCHISIRSVLVFFGVSCRPKVYESLLEDSFQISLQRSLFWYEANRKLMRTTVVLRNRSVNFEISQTTVVFLQLLYVTLSSQRHLAWWTKAKNGVCICMPESAIGRVLSAHEESFKTVSSCGMYFGYWFFSSSEGW